MFKFCIFSRFSITILMLLISVSYVWCECSVTSQTYTTNDGLVIASVAHIVTFAAKCDNKHDGLTLFADINGKTLPVIRSIDGKTYQISWTVEFAKASSGSYSIPVYDSEGASQLRKAQRAGESGSVTPLFTLTHSHSSTYKGPWIQTELIATIAAVLLWYMAYSAKLKLTS